MKKKTELQDRNSMFIERLNEEEENHEISDRKSRISKQVILLLTKNNQF